MWCCCRTPQGLLSDLSVKIEILIFEYNNPAKKLFSPCVRVGDSQAHNVHKKRKSMINASETLPENEGIDL